LNRLRSFVPTSDKRLDGCFQSPKALKMVRRQQLALQYAEPNLGLGLEVYSWVAWDTSFILRENGTGLPPVVPVPIAY